MKKYLLARKMFPRVCGIMVTALVLLSGCKKDNDPVAGELVLNKTALSMPIGTSANLVASVNGGVVPESVLWSSSDESVASVTSSGGVIATDKVGQAVITASMGRLTATCKVEVTNKSVDGISLDKTTVALENGRTATLKVTVKPDDAARGEVTWATTDKEVVTVTGGTLTAMGWGTATVTATADGKTVSCAVTVNKEQDWDMLKALYDAAGGTGWTSKDKDVAAQIKNWCTKKPIKSWYGVKVSSPASSGDRVTELSLDGIGVAGTVPALTAMSELTSFSCASSALTAVAIGGHAKLKTVNVSGNKLSSLTLGNTPKLESLDAGYNALQTLDLTSCTALTNLVVDNNAGLTSLNVDANTALQKLSANTTKLATLDINLCAKLTALSATGCVLLTTVRISADQQKNITAKTLVLTLDSHTVVDTK